MKTASALSRLEIPGIAIFEPGEGDLTRLTVRSSLAEAHIYLHGAHVTHFQPHGQAPVLFMSQRSLFAPDKPIRGGVPVIFPWFASRAGHPESPAHGVARIPEWQVHSLTEDGDGLVTAALQLTADSDTRALWPHDFHLSYRVAIGRALTLTLTVKNTSQEPFTFEDALHSYFAVSDVRQVSVTGLENAEYVDKTDAFKRKRQGPESIRITQETDRVFENSHSTCLLDDPGLHRRIQVEKSGSQTTVIWNPWMAKAAALADFGDDEWPHVLCIETANAGANAITLAPGKTHSTRAVISVA